MTTRTTYIFFSGIVVIVGVLVARLIVPTAVPTQNLALFGQDPFIPVADGTLIRAEDDDRVYYIEGGAKRWIDSAAAFQGQGFRAKDIQTRPADEVVRYPDGEAITIQSLVVLPRERGFLPDIAPLAPSDIHFSSVNGRTVIRFTGSFWNRGRQPFKLTTAMAGPPPTEDRYDDVYQEIQGTDGAVRRKDIDRILFHRLHNHYHLVDFGYYILLPLRSADGAPVAGNPFVHQKTTFCMRDDERMATQLSEAPSTAVFQQCGTEGQGVSVGWIDVYASTLPDQYVDVHDMPPGVYALSFVLDPKQRYLEERKDNNIATTFIQLDVAHRSVQVIAALAPFSHARNIFQDGTLVTTTDTGNVYLLSDGRKRWIRSVDIFNAYGYAWEAIYPVTESMIQAIPPQTLIRQRGSSQVYVLNEFGYRRHVLTPAVFDSYEFSPGDIADILEIDFSAYPEGNLIMRRGDDQVYMIAGTTKWPVGTLSVLQGSSYDVRGLHIVNEVDFNAYTTVQLPVL
jgi:lysyl oxidase